MRKVQPYRFVPQTSYSVEQFDRWSCGSGFPPPEPPFFVLLTLPTTGRRVPPSPRSAGRAGIGGRNWQELGSESISSAADRAGSSGRAVPLRRKSTLTPIPQG